MESGPHKIIETVIGWLIPPASREETLGDLRERYTGTLAYLFEAAHTVPWVIYSRLRRTTDVVLLLMEALALYVSFVLAARWLDPARLVAANGFLKIALPPAAMLLAGLLEKIYRRKPPKMKAVNLEILSAYLAGGWWYHLLTLMVGSLMGQLLVSTIRRAFLPPAEFTKVPASWRKLELAPLGRPLRDVLLRGILIALIYLVYRIEG